MHRVLSSPTLAARHPSPPEAPPRASLLALCLVVAVATALPVRASAAAGFHMSRDFSANGDEGRAYGEQGPIVGGTAPPRSRTHSWPRSAAC